MGQTSLCFIISIFSTRFQSKALITQKYILSDLNSKDCGLSRSISSVPLPSPPLQPFTYPSPLRFLLLTLPSQLFGGASWVSDHDKKLKQNLSKLGTGLALYAAQLIIYLAYFNFCVNIAAISGSTMLEAPRVFGWSAWSYASHHAKHM